MPGPCAARAVIRELRGSPEILDPLCGKGFARKNTRIFGEPLSFPLPERSFMGLPLGLRSGWSEWQTMHSTGWSEAAEEDRDRHPSLWELRSHSG